MISASMDTVSGKNGVISVFDEDTGSSSGHPTPSTFIDNTLVLSANSS